MKNVSLVLYLFYRLVCDFFVCVLCSDLRVSGDLIIVAKLLCLGCICFEYDELCCTFFCSQLIYY